MFNTAGFEWWNWFVFTQNDTKIIDTEVKGSFTCTNQQSECNGCLFNLKQKCTSASKGSFGDRIASSLWICVTSAPQRQVSTSDVNLRLFFFTRCPWCPSLNASLRPQTVPGRSGRRGDSDPATASRQRCPHLVREPAPVWGMTPTRVGAAFRTSKKCVDKW